MFQSEDPPCPSTQQFESSRIETSLSADLQTSKSFLDPVPDHAGEFERGRPPYLQTANEIIKNLMKIVSATPAEMAYTVSPISGTSDMVSVCPCVAHCLIYKCNRYRSR